MSLADRIDLFMLNRAPKRKHGRLVVYNGLVRSRHMKAAETLFGRVGNALTLLESYAPQTLLYINGIVFDAVPGRVTKLDRRFGIAYISAGVIIKGSPIDVAMIIVTHATSIRLIRKGVKLNPENLDRINEMVRSRIIAFLRRVPHASEIHYERARALVAFRIARRNDHLRRQRRELDAYDLPKWLSNWLDRRLEKAEERINQRQ